MNKIKVIGIVTVLVLSISTLGVAFASPNLHLGQSIPTLQQQADQVKQPGTLIMHHPSDGLPNQQPSDTVADKQQQPSETDRTPLAVGHQNQDCITDTHYDDVTPGQGVAVTAQQMGHQTGMYNGSGNAGNHGSEHGGHVMRGHR